jgi:hypothetical protein
LHFFLAAEAARCFLHFFLEVAGGIPAPFVGASRAGAKPVSDALGPPVCSVPDLVPAAVGPKVALMVQL